MTDIIQCVLSEGESTGFAAVEAFGESIEKHEYEESPGEPVFTHFSETQRVTARAFWDTGDPLGFTLSKPHTASIKSAFLNIYSTNLPDTQPNFRHLLPSSVDQKSPSICDNDIGNVDTGTFDELMDQVAEAIIASPFQEMKLNKVTFSKSLKKIYIANSNRLDSKYIKTLYDLVITLSLKQNRVDIAESRVFFNQLHPHKMLSRAYNLLYSLGEAGSMKIQRNHLPIIFSPEASSFILREFSNYFRVRADKEFMQIQYPSILNIIDNPFMDNQPGSVPFDDEGIQGGEKYLVRKGTFSQVITDISTAFEGNTQSSGNGFRSRRSPFPIPKFSNLYIKPTVLPVKNLMTEAKEGVLVSVLRLKAIDAHGYLFSAYGYRFNAEEMMEPVHFYFRTSLRSFLLNIIKISREIRFFYNTFNAGSPYILVEAGSKPDHMYEI